MAGTENMSEPKPIEAETRGGSCAPAPCSAFAIPTVLGRRIRGSNDDFERACLVHIERLQHGLGDYDSAMLDTFCEAVRLVREYNDAMAMPNSPNMIN